MHLAMLRVRIAPVFALLLQQRMMGRTKPATIHPAQSAAIVTTTNLKTLTHHYAHTNMNMRKQREMVRLK